MTEMPAWKRDCVKILQTHLGKATEPKEIRQISSALNSVIGYEDEIGSPSKPMPVRIVKSKPAKKPPAKAWRKKGK